MAVVGIDLGTTNTVIAAVRDGRATALKDKLGRALLPSVVSFSPSGKKKVGYEAKDRRTIDPENTVFSIKRLIGRTFDSEHVQKAISRLPFEIKEGPGKSTMVCCYGAEYTLPEISAMVLEQAAQIGEARLGTQVSDAVITVPANFNDLQRAATKVAGRTAGLEVLRIINEPTAAALAYGFGKGTRERIAVYDFGGGTFDVTLLDLSDNVFEVLATAGDTFLGGDDIDMAIMDRMAEELLKKNKVDANADNLVREQLRAAAEKLKIDLSTRSMGKCRIEELEFEFTLRRSEFEKLAEPLLKRTLVVCQEAMDVAGVSNKDLDQILLVGGSTRIPLVRRRISSFFGKMPQSRINPDEVVAIGAAIQASSLEAKQAAGVSLPAAPRGRGAGSQHPSRAPAPLKPVKGTTRTGLAGLKQTLAGQGGGASREKKTTLTGIRSVPPSGQKLGPAKTLAGVGPGYSDHPSSPPVPALGTAPRGKHNTLAGVGGGDEPRSKFGTLSGVGDKRTEIAAGNTDRKKGSTNLGLGAAPGTPPATGASPPSTRGEEFSFDDETSVNEGAALVAAELDKRARQSQFDDDEEQGTLPGAAAPPGGSTEASTTDGSVTFDLAELEELNEDDSGFTDLESEATAIVDPDKVAARAAQLDSQVDNELPIPDRAEPEEIGGSALIDISESVEEEIADLPAPMSRKPDELGDSALLDLQDDDPDEQVDLPSPASRSALDRTEIGLPAQTAAKPSLEADLPELQARDAGLPLVDAALPSPAGNNLPSPGGALPSRQLGQLPVRKGASRTNSGELRLGLGKTQVAPRGAGIGFDDAVDNAPRPSVQELDELSVAALLPDDDSSAEELDLSQAGLESLSDELRGDTASLGSAAPGQATRAHSSDPGEQVDLADSRISMIEDSVATALSQPPARPAPAPQLPRSPLLLDVTPLSLGVEVIGGYVDKLIERNSPIPCENTRTFATARDNQAMVRVRVSQGDEDRFDRNTLLGEVELTGLSPGPRGSVKVDVSFSLDESGMLQVSARDTRTGNAADARLMLVGVAPAHQ